MKYFLSLETSMTQGSLGIFQIEKRNLSTLLFKKWSLEIKDNKKIHHSERLPLEIKKSLEEIKLTFQDLNFLAVGIGPGRFTGVRTAISTIKTLAFLLKLPTYPVNSLRIVAEPFLSLQDSFCVAFNGFKNSVYFAEFSNGKMQHEPQRIDFSDWLQYMIKKEKKFCVGDVNDFYDISSDWGCHFEKSFPTAQNLAEIVCKEFKMEHLKPWFQLEPLYLRSVVEKKSYF